jgi:hypothetical protein
LRLHLKFKNIRNETVAAAEELFNARPWRMESTTEKLVVAQRFVDTISAQAHIPSAVVTVRPLFGGAGVQYRPAVIEEDSLGSDHRISPPRILLNSFSIINVFHGTRVHLLAHGEAPVSENDPIAWACSLFYKVRPEMFRARVREGRIVGVDARDTYAAETWNRLVVAGVVDDERGTLRISRQDAARIVNGEDPQVVIAEAEAARQAAQEEFIAQAANAAENLFDDPDYDEEFEDDEDEPELPSADYSLLDEADDADEDPEPAQSPTEGSGDDLDSLGLAALRTLAQGRSIPRMWKLGREQLREALRELGVRASA